MNTGGDVADAMARGAIEAAEAGARLLGDVGVKLLIVLYTIAKDVKLKKGKIGKNRNKLEFDVADKDLATVEQLLNDLKGIDGLGRHNSALTQALSSPTPPVKQELKLENSEIGALFAELRKFFESFAPKENEPGKYELTVAPDKEGEAHDLMEKLGLVDPKNREALEAPSRNKSSERGHSSVDSPTRANNETRQKPSIAERMDAMQKASKQTGKAVKKTVAKVTPVKGER